MAECIFVGLSGGVDSAVSAALLKAEGHAVVGVFIKIWQPEFTECSWREDRLDAMRVAAHLGISFREIDLSEEYKREVVGNMIADYRHGITPNPDVLCNRSIKFGHFARWAKAQGADLIATGHYARIVSRNGARELHRGTDENKDQSYFLYQLSQQDLAHVLFPIGALRKQKVRALARRFHLPVAEKHDSQGLCFVGDVSLPDFLSRYIPLASGPVINMQGEVVGQHQGVALYTIGQRHGFTVHSPRPQYIIAIDSATNTLRVSPKKSDAARASITLSDTHWIGEMPAFPAEVYVQARYRESPVAARLLSDSLVEFPKPHVATPGQALVVYRNTVCLGGGTIAE